MPDFSEMLLSDTPTLVRILFVGALAYVALVVFVRISGKRTLASMNAFDLVVTVALGSTLATAMLARDVTLADACLAFALLILLQFVVTWSSVRFEKVRKIVTGEPRLLLLRGEVRSEDLRKARVTFDQAEAVVLETDGSFSVVRRASSENDATALAGLVGK
jgi:uncharacterized membrane protein YcaP (DUF421 family)